MQTRIHALIYTLRITYKQKLTPELQLGILYVYINTKGNKNDKFRNISASNRAEMCVKSISYTSIFVMFIAYTCSYICLNID